MHDSIHAGTVQACLPPSWRPLRLLRLVLLLACAIAALRPSVVLADKAAVLPLGIATASQCGVSMSCPPPVPAATAAAGPGTGSCGPASGGSTCPGTGVASASAASNVNVGAGNPINVINGNKYQREDDMPALPGVLGLEIVRHYNSAYSNPGNVTGILGRGWKLSYETDLHVVGNTIQIIQADGSRVMFNRDPQDPSQCASVDPG